MKQVLLYLNQENTMVDPLFTFLEKESIAYTVIEDSHLNHKIIDLFTSQNKKGNLSKKFPFNFILFSDFTKEDIMSFLKTANLQGIQFSHKAMLTDNNRNWTLDALLKEIEEEHEFFETWEQLHRLLKEANDLDAKLYTEDSYEAYKQSFLKAYMFTKNPQKNLIDEIIQDLEKTKNALRTKIL